MVQFQKQEANVPTDPLPEWKAIDSFEDLQKFNNTLIDESERLKAVS